MAQITDIIKYEGDNSTFVWKHPKEDFNSLTQLIVHESQEALFFMNGQALDLFGPGRYTLETQNLPLLGNAIKKTTGGNSPFHCEVYFINKSVQMGAKWGTPEPIRFIEPTMSVPLAIGASGEMNLQVSDSRKLVVKLVGTMNGIAWEERGMGFSKSLQSCFRPLIVTAVKTHLAAAIKEKGIDIVEIDQHLEELSAHLHKKLLPGFEEYGLTLPQFYVYNINLPESDPNFKTLRELHTMELKNRVIEAETAIRTARADQSATIKAAERKAILEDQITETEIAKMAAERELIAAQTRASAAKMEGFAEAEIMDRKGYTQKDMIQADVQKAYASGLGSMGGGAGGGVVGDIVSLGVSMAAAEQLTQQMGGMFKNTSGAAQRTEDASPAASCPKCGKQLPANAKFCMECGTKIEVLAENEMICPACGQKTPKGKFCMQCGTPLIRKCKNCDAELAEGAKFCPECGTPV